MSSVIQVWVDGACSNNQKKPGHAPPKARSAAYFPGLRRGVSRDLAGELQTNNRAELDAVILVFEELEKAGAAETDVEIFTDSLNVLKWAQKMQRANTNLDLIQKVWQRLATWKGKVIFQHVRGHSGDPNNEIADQLATGKLKDFCS